MLKAKRHSVLPTVMAFLTLIYQRSWLFINSTVSVQQSQLFNRPADMVRLIWMGSQFAALLKSRKEMADGLTAGGFYFWQTAETRFFSLIFCWDWRSCLKVQARGDI